MLLHDDMALVSCDDDALLNGSNLMLVGAELIQFGRAERIGPARYRLSRLLRGRRGTEAAMDGHQAGEEVLLVTRDTLISLDCPAGASALSVMATSIGDAQPVLRTCQITGRATAPLSPVQLRTTRLTDGTWVLSWIRRSRDGWAWLDGVDAPLGEETERYRLILMPDAGATWTEESASPKLILTPAKIASLRASGATALRWSVQQLGVTGQSLAAASRASLT